MNEVSSIQESWNRKRIFLALIVVALFLIGIIYFLKKTKSENSQFKSPFLSNVKGISIKNENEFKKDDEKLSQKSLSLPSTADLRGDLQEKLDSIKQEVSSLKVEEIASSSPQIQKVLDDVKSLEQYPKNQAKEICKNICNSL